MTRQNRVRKLINLDVKKEIISIFPVQMVVLDGNFALGCWSGTNYP